MKKMIILCAGPSGGGAIILTQNKPMTAEEALLRANVEALGQADNRWNGKEHRLIAETLYTKTIYVSDWAGNPVMKYELDRAVVYCKVDENDEYLYAFAYNEDTQEPDLVRFKLPEWEK